MKCRHLKIERGQLYCYNLPIPYRVKTTHEICESCQVYLILKGQHCEYLSVGVRNIVRSIGGGGQAIPALACTKLVKELSSIKECEDCPERSSEFLSREVVEETRSLLKTVGFEGPLAEFNRAFERDLDGDNEGAVTAAHSSFESALKSILEKEKVDYPKHATAKDLLDILKDRGYIYPFLDDFVNSFYNLLTGLSTIRNKIGDAHGSGISLRKIMSSYAEFAIHLAGSFNLFLVKRYIERHQ